MIVSDLRAGKALGVARVEATVTWEDSDAEPMTLYVETEQEHAAALRADPNAFLTSCLLPAWRSGERRIRVEGILCPALTERVKAPMRMLKRWHPGDFGPTPVIEAGDHFAARQPVAGQAIALLSCGVDSLATLRWNVLNIPRDHPDAIVASLFIAYDRDPTPSLARLESATAPRASAVRPVAADAGTRVIPVRTNMWWLAPDGWFFTEKWHGAALASMAAFFSGEYRKGYVASSHNPDVVAPNGSHPLLDPFFSSAHFAIEHDLFSMSRSEKVALIAEWPVGIAHVRVCTNDSEGGPNCGTCEKCIRTQVHLAALGKGSVAAASFPTTSISPGLVRYLEEYDMIRGHPPYIAWYSEAIAGLRDNGLGPVADELRRIVSLG